MVDSLFEGGREGFLDGSIDFDTDTVQAILLELTIADVGIKQITGATNATPIVVTATAHGFANNDLVSISAVLGNTAANGRRRIANVTANTFELVDEITLANIAGNGAYTSGGRAVDLTLARMLSDIDAAQLGSAVTLASKTVGNGIADAADLVFTSVTTGHTAQGLALYKSTGTATTSRLIALYDEGTAGQGFPLPTNGGNVNVTISNLVDRLFRL